MGKALVPWEVLDSEPVVDHRWYRLRRETVRLPSGRVVDDYFVSVRPDVVVVFALTPDDEVVLVRQWKQGRRAFHVELPGGICEDGEDPEDAAARELLEETGYACAELREIGRFDPDPTKNTNAIVAYLGLGARPAAEPVVDDLEEIEIRLVAVARLLGEIRSGRITVAGTIAAVYRALDELGRIELS